MTDIRKLLNQAITAHIQGDAEATKQAFKQVVEQKARNMVAESQQEADYVIELDDAVEYQGQAYGAVAYVDITHYSAATQGNYSPVAGDPSEYYGDDEELEFRVVRVDLSDEDGNVTTITGPEADNVIQDQHALNYIEQHIHDQIERQKEQSQADDWDRNDNW